MEDCGLVPVCSHQEWLALAQLPLVARETLMKPWCCPGQPEHSVATRRQGPQLSVPHHRLQQDGPARPHRGCPGAVTSKPPVLSGARPEACPGLT